MQLGLVGSPSDLESPERVGRARVRDTAAVLREDDIEAQQQPGQEQSRDTPIVRVGLTKTIRGQSVRHGVRALDTWLPGED